MIRAAAAGVLVLCAVSGCGGGDPAPTESSSATSAASATGGQPDPALTTAAPGAPLTDAIARQALLGLDDLTGTFTASNDTAGSSGQVGCLKATDVLSSLPVDVDVRSAFVTAFARGSSGVLSQVLSDADPTTLRSAFTTLRSALASCRRVATAAGAGTAIDLTVTTDTTVGDPAASAQLDVTARGTVTSDATSGSAASTFPYDVRFAISLVGSSLSIVAVYDLGRATTPVVDQLDRLDRLVVDRLAAVS